MDFKDLEYFLRLLPGAATSPARPSSSTSASAYPFQVFAKLEGDTGLVLFQRRAAASDLCGPAVFCPRRAAAQPEAGDGRELTDLLRADTGVLHGHAAVPVQLFAAGGASGVPRAVPAGAVPH